MEIVLQTVSLSSAQQVLLSRVMEFDFSREKQYLVNRWKKNKETIERMETEFKRYMFLRALYPELRLPISKGVDDFWHAAVLSTRNYENFCLGTLGAFMHHNPTVNEEENWMLMPEYLNNTIRLYRDYFGDPSKDFWSCDYTEGACCIC